MAVFIHPTSCGFAKTVLHFTRLSQHYFSDDLEHLNDVNEQLEPSTSVASKLERYSSFFLNKKDYTVNLRTFRNGMTKLKLHITKLSRDNPIKKTVCFSVFNPNVYEKLSNTDKLKHKLKNCKECIMKYSAGLESFSNLSVIQMIQNNSKLQTPGIQAEIALSNLNKTFQNKYNQSFTDIIAKTPSSGLIKKPTKEQKRNQKENC